MIQGLRYVHTNLIAKNWRALAHFYVSVLGCEMVPPIRDFPATAVEAGTGVPGASLSGVHLRLPGHGPTGPTMEIFTYSEQPVVGAPAAANRPGVAHIAFAVSSSSKRARRSSQLEGGLSERSSPSTQQPAHRSRGVMSPIPRGTSSSYRRHGEYVLSYRRFTLTFYVRSPTLRLECLLKIASNCFKARSIC